MADSWLPTVKDWVNGAVVTEANLDEEIRDRMTAIYNTLTADASADPDIWHGHKSGTLANRPTAVHAGRLYYATDLGVTFHDTGTRWDIMSVNHRIADHFFDDFWWAAVAGSDWQEISSGGDMNDLSTTRLDSIVGMETTATITRRAGLGAPTGTTRAWDITRIPAIWQCRVKVASASRLNEQIFIGLIDTVPAVGTDLDNVGTTNKRIGFQKSDAGAEGDWKSVTCDASVVKNAITGFQNASFHLFEIVVRTAAAIDFYVDGTLKFTHSTQIPTQQLRQALYIDNTAAADKKLYPDYVEFVSARV